MKAERMRIFAAIVPLFLLPEGITTLAQDASSPGPRKLTNTEAEKFWPVNEQYISEQVKINGTKCVLFKQYLQSGRPFCSSNSSNYAPTDYQSVEAH